jgi:hypothetical protein
MLGRDNGIVKVMNINQLTVEKALPERWPHQRLLLSICALHHKTLSSLLHVPLLILLLHLFKFLRQVY